nr:unnamed protein product [Callosobruchus chinensis]
MHAMDYPTCRDLEAHVQKPLQYYEVEHDYSAYSAVPRSSPNEKPNYLYCQDSFRRLLNTSNHYSDRRSPIYVHKYEKIPSTVQENLHQAKQSKANPKVMLDKLEENYWATWKPKNSFKNKNVAHGDTHESWSKYSNRCDYDASSSVVQETCHHHHHHQQKNPNSYHDKVLYNSERQMQSEETHHETREQPQPDMTDETNHSNIESRVTNAKFISKNDQEIQTEYILAPQEEIQATDDKNIAQTNADTEPLIDKDKHAKKKKPSRKEKRRRKKEEPDIKELFLESATKCVDSTEESTPNLEPEVVDRGVKGLEEDLSDNKLLRHKDSFIIHRKKQSEVKQFLQQPKCIRLYRKSTPSYTSRGGSYPLRSCLKKETGFFSAKGNFRLGAPGKPLFVTNSSYCTYI